MQIESICIVGGGSSGWMSAALLSKEHPDMEICLIESENVKPIGVGESTLAHFNRYLKRLDLKDKDWMPACNATYKAGIAFTNFTEGKGERFDYPFGAFVKSGGSDFHQNLDNPEETGPHIMRFFELQAMYGKDKYPSKEFAKFVNRQTYLVENNIMTDSIPNADGGPYHYTIDHDTSYHMNADLFGIYLRDNIAVPNGVHHLIGDVNNVIKTPDGDISAITTEDGQCISADLFIDCTGFRSLLLEQHMGVKFKPFSDMLFNDRALATHIEYDDKETQMECSTNCIALKNGWVYNIPMWNNIGTGYIYSSKYISDDEAEEEFRSYLPESAHNCQLHPIKIKHGKHLKGWVKNVVGIGLAYGFLEPLESTGLMTTHENLIILTDLLHGREGRVTNHEREIFNYTTERMLEAMKNFVTLHYTMSLRDDSKYWRDATESVSFWQTWHEDTTEAAFAGLGDYRSLMDYNHKKMFNHMVMGEGMIYVAAGQGIRPFTENLFYERADDDRIQDVKDYHVEYQRDKDRMNDWVTKQPSHYQYLKDNIYV